MAGGIDTEIKYPTTRSKTVRPAERKNVAPKTMPKKLPWLDGKSSHLFAASPDSVLQTDTPSSTTYSPSRKRPIPTIPKRTTTTSFKADPTVRPGGTIPALRRKSLISPTERNAVSISNSSPSPVTRHRISQIRRESLARKAAKPSKAREPQKRLSIVHYAEEEPEKSVPGRFRPRADSLAPVPDHLQRSITPESIRIPLQRHVVMTPEVVSRVQVSPTQPVPGRSVFERAGNRKISNAIEGLEDMVQEAVDIAQDTTDRGQVEEIYEIIEDARDAIQEASGEPARHLMTTVSPLAASESSSDEGIVSTSSSQSSYGGYPNASKSSKRPPHQPALVQRNTPNHPIGLKPHVVPHGDSASLDWAYPPPKLRFRETSTSSSSSSDRSKDGGGSKFSTGSDLLLPPKQAQPARREHVDFVLRPIHRDESRGRSRRRLVGETRGHRHRRHRSLDNGDRSRHRRARSSSLGRVDMSFDDEAPLAKSYGGELRVREQAHHHTFSLRRHHRRQPIARNWSTGKKRFTASIACVNTALLGIIIGAGEVPRIQYYLADERHHVILGNVVLYLGLAISTFIAWPLPLLHGRKPYVLAALALALPLQFPQAIVVSAKRSPTNATFRTGLLCARAASGLVLGFANVNYITVLLDLFGASLQSTHPHQEFVVANDVRRHGGGMGMWLGIWSWCWIGSLAMGFQIGASIIQNHNPAWGFYVVTIILAGALVLNIIAPETRRAAYRKSVTEVYDRDENYITRRVSRGEIKLHVSTEGPLYWFEEVWAGMKLMLMMMCQPGFFILALYLAWIYAQIVLVIVLLGALLSRSYRWQPHFVGAGVTSIAIGAFLAIPLTKAGIFSRERKRAFRTDSMTFQKQVTWSSHLVRRALFTLTLPLMGLAYTVSSAGRPRPYMVPIVFAGGVGFFSNLAIAECHGLMMETFDTCDLQPGVNTRHRLVSMAVQDRRRRTNYSSFPRVTAGIFASQTLAFLGAAIATEVGGIMTRNIGAMASTGVTAGILLGLTVLLTAVLWRFRQVQVIPNHTFGTRRDTAAWEQFKDLEKAGRGADWKAVVIGNPSGKMRRMSVLELGGLSRWTEIRKLNFLIRGEGDGEAKRWGV
ncbi:hypothetical protein P153DRAFT_397963 [Dothidotthia symphoricarpi CBS 119687]|uniref:MFS general substrate transporter n=1 Tax=Dothidotthia symphoricarpi CBS 119687 TaxID=1392245 RepID=A0A6A6AB44_9PLEO|nr:uncharacterized protein P153DRAFT_397963 [Dothidotthia symphoricarpi CBS 119687]KAF2128098.1 hypothetical protein P153DRAFT_397963 [Dothidotthia symphoricarpi CBS 119687]